MNTWQSFSLGSITTILLLGIIILIATPLRGEPIELSPSGTPVPIMVYVSGSVESPGVYTLPYGSRTVDAVLAAAGLSTDADTNALNMAKILQDGDRIHVPDILMDNINSDHGNVPDEPELSDTGGPPLNLNNASVDDLVQLPGIGDIKAQSIVKYREENGRFQTIEEIMEVDGIGQTIFDRINKLIKVD